MQTSREEEEEEPHGRHCTRVMVALIACIRLHSELHAYGKRSTPLSPLLWLAKGSRTTPLPPYKCHSGSIRVLEPSLKRGSGAAARLSLSLDLERERESVCGSKTCCRHSRVKPNASNTTTLSRRRKVGCSTPHGRAPKSYYRVYPNES